MRIIETAIKPKYRIGQEVRVDAGICKITHIYYRRRNTDIIETVNENPEITYLCEFREVVNYSRVRDDIMESATKIFSAEYKESDILEVIDSGLFANLIKKQVDLKDRYKLSGVN